ncbi:hypothetical protein JCM10213_007835 [Rhodosporidiobolus nylandii]
MAFFNRPTYTASWLNQRIFPRSDEPYFGTDSVPSPSRSSPTSVLRPPASQDSEERTLPDGRTLRFVGVPAPSPSLDAPSAPPPIYYPGQARRRSQEDLPPGHIPSINTASTLHATVRWAYHPTAPRGGWGKYLRVRELWRAVKGDEEKLWDGWPREFGGRELPPGEAEERGGAGEGDEEEGGGAGARRRSRSRSRSLSLSAISLSRQTTRADSGVGLAPRSTMSLEVQHPLYPLYKTRIAELNEIISEQLTVTRVWLALLEIMNYVWFVALIIALATGKGKQTGFLKGVEIALVLVILLNGTGVNGVRMRRYTLSRALRAKQRDWSPLPTTLSTTNRQLMRNYLDGDVAAHNGTGDIASAMPKDRASLRWRLRETEGSYWLSYRPLIRVELVTPASATNPLAYLPVVDLENNEDTAPPPAEAVRREEAQPQAQAQEGPGAPPGYDEAVR